MAMNYAVYIESEVHEGRRNLPGHVRQRIGRLIGELAHDPRPSISQHLDDTDIAPPEKVELRRIRLEHWRLIYAVNDQEQWAWVLGLYRRPPYDYENLDELVQRLR
jgi:mRNA interferase RelE/StbE